MIIDHPSFLGEALWRAHSVKKNIFEDPRFLPSSYLADSPTLARQLPMFLPPLNYNRSMNSAHWIENPIYVFLFWNCVASVPIFTYTCLWAIYLCISRIGPHISFIKIGRSIVGIYKSLTATWMWKLGRWRRNSFSGNNGFEFSVLVFCSAHEVNCLCPSSNLAN